jgi:hypothetical protein
MCDLVETEISERTDLYCPKNPLIEGEEYAPQRGMQTLRQQEA